MNECLQQINNQSQKGVTNFNWGHYFLGLIGGQF